MVRNAYRLLGCACLLFVFHLPCALSADRTVQISLSVKDHFSQAPLQGARAVLLHRGEEVAAVYTDNQGQALIMHTITGIGPILPGPSSFISGHSHPNPFASETQVPLYLMDPQTLHVRVIGQDGRQVLSGRQQLPVGHHSLDLRLGYLSPGVYFLNIHGRESHTLRLLKTGQPMGSAADALRFSTGTHLPDDWAPVIGEGLHPEKNAGLEYALEISKDRYTGQSAMLTMAGDTTLHFPLKRLNQVVFTTTDEEGDATETELLVSGDYFNMAITTPDTLWMHAGTYQVTCEEEFVKAFRKEKQIAAADTAFHFEIEKTEATVFYNDDPDSDMLFLAEHEDGSAFYYHGLREEPGSGESQIQEKWYGHQGILVAYLTIHHRDGGGPSVLIFNRDYYPIRWITDYYNYSAHRLPGQEVFDPGSVPFSAITEPWEDDKEEPTHHGRSDSWLGTTPSRGGIPEVQRGKAALSAPAWEVPVSLPNPAKQAKSREDTATLNIRVGNLWDLVAWAEQETGETWTWHMVRWFLNEYEDDFDIIRERARTRGDDQDLYVRMAIGFASLASAKTFTEASRMEYDKLPFTPRVWPKPPPIRNPVTLAQGMLGCAVQAEMHRRNTDRSGIVVRVLVCRGASEYDGICQNTFYISNALPCVVVCKVTIDCFVDICAPDVLNIQKALEIAEILY